MKRPLPTAAPMSMTFEILEPHRPCFHVLWGDRRTMSRRSLQVDMSSILDAMSSGPDQPIVWYLDLEEGRVELEMSDSSLFSDGEDEGPSMADEPERYVAIEPVETNRQYRWRAEWASALDEEDLREMLEVALEGRGAFGRFRSVLSRYPDLEADWRATEQRLLLDIAEEWIREDLEIEPVYNLLEPQAPKSPERSKPKGPKIDLVDLLLCGAPDGQDEPSMDRVLRRVPARNRSEGRRIFKVLAREIAEWNGAAWRKKFIKGTNEFEMGRFLLTQRDDAVELLVEVPQATWDVFYVTRKPGQRRD